MFSGHTSIIVMSMIIFYRMNCFENKYSTWFAGFFMLALMFAALSSVIVCRSHYTADVIVALYMAHYISEWYFLRADGVMPHRFGARLVRWFEGHDVTQKGLSERAGSMASLASSGNFDNMDLVPMGSSVELGPPPTLDRGDSAPKF
jgi:hypothetical protein